MPAAEVDLFVRPEELRVAEPGASVAINGIVAAQIYQGGHVDLYIDVAEAASGRVLLRLPGHQAMSRWPAGSRVALAVGEAVAFAPTADALIRPSA
jgi:putative spermidine/putrescine transport system ATP-binding protein